MYTAHNPRSRRQRPCVSNSCLDLGALPAVRIECESVIRERPEPRTPINVGLHAVQFAGTMADHRPAAGGPTCGVGSALRREHTGHQPSSAIPCDLTLEGTLRNEMREISGGVDPLLEERHRASDVPSELRHSGTALLVQNPAGGYPQVTRCVCRKGKLTRDGKLFCTSRLNSRWSPSPQTES